MTRSRSMILFDFQPHDLLSQMQDTLAPLADTDTRFETEREALGRATTCDERRSELGRELEIRREAARQPLVQCLEPLNRETALPLFARVGQRDALH